MTNILILNNQYTDITRHADPEDRWDADNTSTDHNIYGFKVVSEKQYYDLTVDFDCKKDHAYQLLYVLYSTGDSFSHHDGKIEFIGMFADPDLAIKNKKIIENQYRKDASDWSLTLYANHKTKYKMHAPWCGYFESLESVEIVDVSRMEDY